MLDGRVLGASQVEKKTIWETPSKERGRVLCKEACFAKKCALQKCLRKEACSAKKRAVQRSVLCKQVCSAKEAQVCS